MISLPASNRTLQELKLFSVFANIINPVSSNRTLQELKHVNVDNLQFAGKASNRTLQELKLQIMYNKSHRGFFQSYLTGIETWHIVGR